MGFGKADYIDTVNCDAPKSAVFSVDINAWQGIEKVQLGLKAIKINIFNEQDIDFVTQAANMRLFESFRDGFTLSKPCAGAQLSAEEACRQLLEHKTGSLAIVNDVRSLKKMLELVVQNDARDNVDIYIGTLPAGHDFGSNAILAMPYRNAIPRGEFQRIYIGEHTSRTILAEDENIICYKASDPFEAEKHFDRAAFAALYKTIKENSHRFSVWSSVKAICDVIREHGSTDISIFGMKLALNVFSELEFISLEEADGMLRIMFADNIRKRQLTDSLLYNKYINIFKTKEKAG